MAMASNTCAFVEGRLLEIRVARGYKSVDDVEEMIGMIGENIAKLPESAKFCIAADWRAVHLMPPDTASRAREMLARVNPRVTRSAILTLPEEAVTNLQVLRLVREAENSSRRAFSDARAMTSWLSEVLSPAEATRLKRFLKSEAA
jgi:hypothetical protein